MNVKKIIPLLFCLLISGNLQAQFFTNTEIPEVKVNLEVIPAELNSGESFTVYATYQIPEHYHMFLNEDLFNIYIENDDVSGEDTIYPMEESEELMGQDSFSGTVTIEKTFNLSDTVKVSELDLEIKAAYQICEDDGTCLLPEEVLFNRTLTINGESRNSNWTLVLWYILLAFAGGIILNVMPCVLPLLSVKALNLVEQSQHERKTIIKSSLLYGAGIWVSFISLALIVIILKSSGEVFGWGFQFQNPLFVLVLLTAIFVFSLSLFDLYAFNPPSQGVSKASQYSAGKSYSSSFLTGIFAVLIATPCTAPFMGAALGFAFSQTIPVIILIFSFLSFGFALPFILLGVFPALIKKIPKPGKWMNTFKEFMGFLLLGTVVYLLTSLHSLIGDSIKGVLWFLLLTGLAIWIFGRFGSVIEKRSRRIVIAIVTVAIIVSSAYFFIDLEKVDSTIVIKEDSIWQEFSTELVETYRAEGKPVFVDFYADWCTSCKVNDAAVLDRQKTLDLFKEYDVQMLKGDFTAGDREIAQWLSDYERAGVPLYLLFRPGEEAVVFPEFLSYGMIEDEVILITP